MDAACPSELGNPSEVGMNAENSIHFKHDDHGSTWLAAGNERNELTFKGLNCVVSGTRVSVPVVFKIQFGIREFH